MGGRPACCRAHIHPPHPLPNHEHARARIQVGHALTSRRQRTRCPRRCSGRGRSRRCRRGRQTGRPARSSRLRGVGGCGAAEWVPGVRANWAAGGRVQRRSDGEAADREARRLTVDVGGATGAAGGAHRGGAALLAQRLVRAAGLQRRGAAGRGGQGRLAAAGAGWLARCIVRHDAPAGPAPWVGSAKLSPACSCQTRCHSCRRAARRSTTCRSRGWWLEVEGSRLQEGGAQGGSTRMARHMARRRRRRRQRRRPQPAPGCPAVPLTGAARVLGRAPARAGVAPALLVTPAVLAVALLLGREGAEGWVARRRLGERPCWRCSRDACPASAAFLGPPIKVARRAVWWAGRLRRGAHLGAAEGLVGGDHAAAAAAGPRLARRVGPGVLVGACWRRRDGAARCGLAGAALRACRGSKRTRRNASSQARAARARPAPQTHSTGRWRWGRGWSRSCPGAWACRRSRTRRKPSYRRSMP